MSKKRNNYKAYWWKKSCITRTLNFWLKFRTKFCALHSNKYGNCFRIVFIQKRCCLNICLVGRLLFFALTGQHLAFVFFTLSSTGGVQRIVWLSKFLTSRHVQMLRIAILCDIVHIAICTNIYVQIYMYKYVQIYTLYVQSLYVQIKQYCTYRREIRWLGQRVWCLVQFFQVRDCLRKRNIVEI